MSYLDNTTTAIVFQGGAYGNYLKWILHTLLTDNEKIVVPWQGNGTSHDQSYIKNDKFFNVRGHFNQIFEPTPKNIPKVFTVHPKTDQEHDMVSRVRHIQEHVDKVLFLYQSTNTYLLGVNNYMYKIWNDLRSGPLGYINPNDLYHNWNIAYNTPFEKIPRWILREYFSYNVFTSWESQQQWFMPDQYQHKDCFYIFVDHLLFNFLGTIEKIRVFLGREWTRDPKDLLIYHMENLKNQKYLFQDVIAKNIIDSVLDKKNCNWNDQYVTIFTEAFVQKKLREHGLELRCNGLNVFPTCTEDLFKVIDSNS